MLQKACFVCKIVGIIAIIGCLNWGFIGLTGENFIEAIFGAGTAVTRTIYVLAGISGLALLASFFMVCPACKKS